jgi:hypothetical protein
LFLFLNLLLFLATSFVLLGFFLFQFLAKMTRLQFD